MTLVQLEVTDSIAVVTLNDPARRNALSNAMFDGLEAALEQVRSRDDLQVLLLRGQGPVFCAGFDLAAAANDEAMLGQFILRLSRITRGLRRLPQIVIAAVQGAAIAGGCALISACDFVFASPGAKFGYPVHRLGLSPAVTIPTLHQAIGGGRSRSLLMSGELLDAAQAQQIGLVTQVTASDHSLLVEARAHADSLLSKGVQALRVTKLWLNELDGTMDDSRFDRPTIGSANATRTEETRDMLKRWEART